MSIRLLFGLVAVLLLTACGKSDADISSSIKAQLLADDTVQAHTLDVETRDRVVTLSGTAESERERERALEIARGVEGVTEVVDHISVVSAETEASATTGTTGEAAPRPELPETASPLPRVVLVATLCLVAAIVLKRTNQLRARARIRQHNESMNHEKARSARSQQNTRRQTTGRNSQMVAIRRQAEDLEEDGERVTPESDANHAQESSERHGRSRHDSDSDFASD
jgi:hypothetical protein